jgi:dTDP-glucose 4,6-dehydratase
LPVYGDGQNVRDWLHVSDHCSALLRVLEAGAAGESYNIGGSTERSNLELVHALLDVVERLFPAASNAALSGRDYRSLIRFVTDRPGHDRRYAIDSTKLRTVLGWQPHWTLERGLEDIVRAALEKRHS